MKIRWKRIISIIGVVTLITSQSGVLVMAQDTSEEVTEEVASDSDEGEIVDETGDTTEDLTEYYATDNRIESGNDNKEDVPFPEGTVVRFNGNDTK